MQRVRPIKHGGLVQFWLFVLIVAVLAFVLANPAEAKRINGGLTGGVLVPPATIPDPTMPNQFDMVGYLETATVDPTMCPALDPRLWGGTAKMNGQTVTIPCNTILQMPAFAMSWADLFNAAPKDIMPAGSAASGLGLGDTMANGTAGLLNMTWTAPTPTSPTTYNAALPAHEFHLVGNIINGQYIAGLVFISQQSLNDGQGVISCIDYATGELQVGGTPLPHGSACPPPDGTFTRVRMNDPVGRFGIVHGGPNSTPGTVDVIEPGYDPRFTADTDNPTMRSQLGYPVCVPAFNPFNITTDPITGLALPAAVDAKCPIYNRPIAPNCKSFDPATLLPAFGPQPTGSYCTTWVMDLPGARALNAEATDPTVSAPLVIGDTINFHGTMKADANGPYISAHSIEANLGIYTQPHVPPAYVTIESMGVGTGGGTVGGVAIESTNKVFWTGFSTDPTELVDFYSLHQDPQTGATTAYIQGTFNPCCTPLGRFRSPVNNLGSFGEPQRNYQAVSRTMCQTTPPSAQLQTRCMLEPPTLPDATAVQVAPFVNQNGLVAGQFTLPNFEFIFGENLAFGGPIIPANFQDIPFLFCGSGPLDGPNAPASPRVGQLLPPPWASPMADPLFHASLCPNELTVTGAAGSTIVPPPAPLPAVISGVTATPSLALLATTTAVVLAATATDPNTPANTLSYAWTFTAPNGVSVAMSCGTCLANAGSASVTANITVGTAPSAGPVVFTVSVSNGVLPVSTSTVSVQVPSANSKPPTINKITAPGQALAGAQVTISALGTTNPSGGSVTFAFKQISGPNVFLNGVAVPLNQALPSTFTGSAALNNQTGSTTFTAPISTAKLPNMVFAVTETDPSTGLSTTQQVTIQVAQFVGPDAVTVTGAAYRAIVSRVGQPSELGKFTITVTSSANVAPPTGWSMSATLTATLANGTVSTPIVLPLLLTPADVPGTLTPTCGASPCWAGNLTGIITDNSVTPSVLIAPDTIVIKSSLGGTTTVLKGNPIYVIR